jgi:hypothetical protein
MGRKFMFDFKKQIASRQIQNNIGELMSYKNKIQLSEFGEYKNDIDITDITRIANLLFEIGKQPLNDFNNKVELTLKERRKKLKTIGTEEQLLSVIFSIVSDELLFHNVLEAILKNYLSDPYSFFLPEAVTDAEKYIFENQNYIEDGIKLILSQSTQFNSEDEFLDYLRNANILTLYKFTVARSICGQIFININEHDKDNATHYLLQDIFNAYATPFYDELVYVIDNSETSIKKLF